MGYTKKPNIIFRGFVKTEGAVCSINFLNYLPQSLHKKERILKKTLMNFQVTMKNSSVMHNVH